ncbi:hypothetical protein [Ewingella americana]|nr:hypothetical protein [Ewingella americana]
MSSLITSAISQAVKGVIVVTLTPSINGFGSRDLHFFQNLSSQVIEYLQNCDPVFAAQNNYESKTPLWLQDNAHPDYWLVRLMQIPLAQTSSWIGVDLYFADGVRGYLLKEVRFFTASNSTSWRVDLQATRYNKIVKADSFNVRSLIECCYTNIEQMLLKVYKNSPALEVPGTATRDEVAAGLKTLVKSWNGRSNAPDWYVLTHGATDIEVGYEYTFRRNTRVGEWLENSSVRNAAGYLDSVIAEARKLNAKIKVTSLKPLTKDEAQRADDVADRNNGSAYSEYEQSMCGSVLLTIS